MNGAAAAKEHTQQNSVHVTHAFGLKPAPITALYRFNMVSKK